jgi:hypothetical protein
MTQSGHIRFIIRPISIRERRGGSGAPLGWQPQPTNVTNIVVRACDHADASPFTRIKCCIGTLAERNSRCLGSHLARAPRPHGRAARGGRTDGY